MQETYCLNGERVTMPKGIDALTLQKQRNPRYWSILYKNIGWAASLGRVTFLDQISRRILLDAYSKSDTQAVIPFRAQFDGEGEHTAYVDMDTLSWNRDGVSCAFADVGAVVDLEGGATRRLGLLPTTELYLPGFAITGIVPLFLGSADLATGGRGMLGKGKLPLLMESTSDKTNVLAGVLSVADGQSFYQNSTTLDVQVQLVGSLSARWHGSDSSQGVSLWASVVSGAGANLSRVNLGRLLGRNGPVVSPTALDTILLNLVLPVAAGCKLTLNWEADVAISSPNSLRVTYTQAVLTLRVADATHPPTRVLGVMAGELLGSMVSQLTGGALTLSSRFLTTGAGAGLWLGSGARLRGLTTGDIISTLESVFTALSNLYCLALWVDDATATVCIEPLGEYLAQLERLELPAHRLKGVTYSPNPLAMPDTIETGFSLWRGESVVAGREWLGPRRYITPRPARRRTLDLSVSGLIGSPVLLEEQRQKAFAGVPVADGADKYDTSLFVVDTGPLGAYSAGLRQPITGEVLSGPPSQTGGTAINLSLTPARQMARWLNVWPVGLAMPDESQAYGEGLSRLEGEGLPVDEQTALIGGTTIFSGLLTQLDLSLTREEYAQLNGWILFSDTSGPEENQPPGSLYRVLPMSASWKMGSEGASVCQVQGYLAS